MPTRRDFFFAQLTKLLKARSATIEVINWPANGEPKVGRPTILIGYRGINFAFEIPPARSPAPSTRTRPLTPPPAWAGKVYKVSTPGQIIRRLREGAPKE